MQRRQHDRQRPAHLNPCGRHDDFCRQQLGVRLFLCQYLFTFLRHCAQYDIQWAELRDLRRR